MCPLFSFGSPLYTLSSSVVLNSSVSSRTYLFSSLEKQSPKSNESRNARHFEMYEFAYFTLCKPTRNVTRAQYFTAFIEHKHWINTATRKGLKRVTRVQCL